MVFLLSLILSDWWSIQSPADLVDLWDGLNWLSRTVLVVLLVMLVDTVVQTALLTVKHASARKLSKEFEQRRKKLNDGQIEDVISVAERFNDSHIARVTGAGLRTFLHCPLCLGAEEALGCAERAMMRVTTKLSMEMRVGLGTLRTIASTAPFFGLFGTLLGILDSFRGYSGTPFGWIVMVLGGFSIALVFSAMGITVAVLAAWAHNWLATKATILSQEMKNASLEVMLKLAAHPEWLGIAGKSEFGEVLEEQGQNARSWEVEVDGHGALLLSVWAFELYFLYLIVWGLQWSATSHFGYAYTFGFLAFVVAAFAVWVRIGMRKGAGCAPGRVFVNNRFSHLSVEHRREQRLALQERFAALPDRTVVFGTPAIVLLLMTVIINQPSTQKGIPVGIESTRADMKCQRLVVQVERAAGSDLYRPSPQFRVQGKLVTEDGLSAQIECELKRRADQSVLIYGDDEIAYDAVVKAADVVSGLGGNPVLVDERAAKQ